MSAVKSILAFQRVTSRLGLAHLFYAICGVIPYLFLQATIGWRNEIEILGEENFPKDQGCFLLCNHTSMGEAPMLAVHFFPWRAMWFPAKAEFYKNWPISLIWTFITASHTFPVRRGERDASAIRLIETFLKKGDNVLLFPEGSRSRDGELKPGKKGVGMIIHNARPAVIPVYATGFADIVPPGKKRIYGGKKATIIFGERLNLDHYYAQDLSKDVARGIVDEVMSAIAELKSAHERRQLEGPASD